MTYLSWARLVEGRSDALYFDVLLPRLLEEIILQEGVRHADVPSMPAVQLGRFGRHVDEVSKEVCANRDAFEMVFIHGDTGGRSLESGVNTRTLGYCRRMEEECGWPLERCVTITPRHETEAWVLADPFAVTAALGFHGHHRDVGLPDNATEAERLPDPKETLTSAVKAIARSRPRAREVAELFPAIAQRQAFELLRVSQSFRAFEARLKTCLRALHCIS